MTRYSVRTRLRAALWRAAGSLHPRAGDEEMEEEMRFHLEMLTDRYARGGLSPEAARRAALVHFGGRDQWREAGRDARRSRVLEDLVRDLRHGAALLRRQPAFAATTILTI